MFFLVVFRIVDSKPHSRIQKITLLLKLLYVIIKDKQKTKKSNDFPYTNVRFLGLLIPSLTPECGIGLEP